jgi:hypothetical protein
MSDCTLAAMDEINNDDDDNKNYDSNSTENG